MVKTRTAPSPQPSALTNFIHSNNETSAHSTHHMNLALQVQHDLQYQHEWNSLAVHMGSPLGNASTNDMLARPLLSGIAPRHVYIHPDDQVEMLKQGIKDKDVPVQREWVLPTHLREKWSLRQFAEVFDAIGEVPPSDEQEAEKFFWKGRNRGKRLLMAVVNDDSTIVYYIIHDGIVKPRQN